MDESTREQRKGSSSREVPLDLGFAHSAGRASPIEVARVSELRLRKLDHSIYQPARLDFHLIQFVVAGGGRHWSDFESVELRAGDLLHIRPRQVHAFDRGSDHEALMIFFTPNALAQAHLPAPVRWEPNTVLRPAADDFAVLISMLEAQAALDRRAVALDSGAVAPHLLAAILEGLANVARSQRAGGSVAEVRAEEMVHALERLLDQHHASSRSAAWYAKELHVTERSLGRACQRVRGLSPKRLIDLRVILEAKRWLSTSSKTVEAVGLGLGFSEATNFVKFFRRMVGETPEAFRQRVGVA